MATKQTSHAAIQGFQHALNCVRSRFWRRTIFCATDVWMPSWMLVRHNQHAVTLIICPKSDCRTELFTLFRLCQYIEGGFMARECKTAILNQPNEYGNLFTELRLLFRIARGTGHAWRCTYHSRRSPIEERATI